MRSRRVISAVCIVAVVLVLGGCSSGGGKQSTPTTSVTAPTATTVPSSSVVAAIGQCPTQYNQYSSLNAGAKGLDRRLVPFDALVVRVCRYNSAFDRPSEHPLVASALLSGPAATHFEDDTNRLEHQRDPGCHLFNRTLFFVVTFASIAHKIDIVDWTCYYALNGALDAKETSKWREQLLRSTDTNGTVVGTVREVGGVGGISLPHGASVHHRGVNLRIPGTVIATNASGAVWQTKTTATRPFSLALPTGTYRLTGRSPFINSGHSNCSASTPVVVVEGKTTQVKVVCNIR